MKSRGQTEETTWAMVGTAKKEELSDENLKSYQLMNEDNSYLYLNFEILFDQDLTHYRYHLMEK